MILHVIVIDAVSASFVLAILQLGAIGIIDLDIHAVFLLNDLLGFGKHIEFFDVVTIIVLDVDLGIHVLQRIILRLFLAKRSLYAVKHSLLILLDSIGTLDKLGGLHLLSRG